MKKSYLWVQRLAGQFHQICPVVVCIIFLHDEQHRYGFNVHPDNTTKALSEWIRMGETLVFRFLWLLPCSQVNVYECITLLNYGTEFTEIGITYLETVPNTCKQHLKINLK